MDCACVYVDNSDGSYDDWGDEIRVAGVERTCSECRREIALGEEYEDAFGAHLDDDENVLEMHTYVTCRDCVSMRNSFFCHGWACERIWYDLGEHLDEVVRFGDGVSSDCLTPLTKAARDDVCDLIEKIWEEWDEEEEEEAA